MVLKKTLIASLVLLTGLLVISCPDLDDITTTLINVIPVNAHVPVITGQPQGGTWDVDEDDTFTLTVTANGPDDGTLSYQWYRNTVNAATGGAAAGTDNTALTLAKEDYTAGDIFYFYVVVTNTIADNGDGGTKTATVTSNAAAVTVTDRYYVPPVNAEQPSITVQPIGDIWDVDEDDAFTLTVTANSPDDGELSFQWYNDTEAIGTDDATLTLSKNDYEAGDIYYFHVVVTNTITDNGDGGTKTATVTSNAAAVTVIGDGIIAIHSKEDMEKIGADTEYPLSGKYLLMDDITLEGWTPIGTTATPFTGVFSGGGKTITLQSFAGTLSGNPVLAGIFGQITGTADDKAQMKNLTIHADNINQTSAANLQIGLLAGNATYADISHITVTGSLTCGNAAGVAAPANTRLGGIVGVITSSAIEKSTANAAITVTGIIQTGGIAGNAGGTTAISAVTISGCENKGAIVRDGPGADAMTGGIAGSLSGPGSVIIYCMGTGDITITGGTTTNTFPTSAYTGGLVGQVASNGKIEQSFATGNVSFDSGSATYVGIGGIAGRTQGATGDTGMTIQDCYTTGNIQGKTTVTATAAGGIYAGGIVGLINAGLINAPITTTVSRCYATGAITAERSADPSVAGTAPGVNPGGIVGGPFGNANVKAQIQNCVALNTGIKAIYALRPPNIRRIANTITTNAATPAVYAPDMTNNKAWSGMSLITKKIIEDEEVAVDPEDMEIGSDKNDGEDCDQRPAQSDYTGWDFASIWQMSGGLPILRGF